MKRGIHQRLSRYPETHARPVQQERPPLFAYRNPKGSLGCVAGWSAARSVARARFKHRRTLRRHGSSIRCGNNHHHSAFRAGRRDPWASCGAQRNVKRHGHRICRTARTRLSPVTRADRPAITRKPSYIWKLNSPLLRRDAIPRPNPARLPFFSESIVSLSMLRDHPTIHFPSFTEMTREFKEAIIGKSRAARRGR